MAVLAAGAVWAFTTGRYCAYPGTDFRGYYASAHIIWRSGFSAVYNPEMQRDTQAELPIRCPDGSMAAPRMMVMVPYLPVFINLFLPLPGMDYSWSYITWTLITIAGMIFYLRHFLNALDMPVSWLQLFQWLICLPFLANLTLGQSNLLLVICLGEFTLAMLRAMSSGKQGNTDQQKISGLWLSGLLLKPLSLILLIPGLVVGRRWKTLAAFTVSGMVMFVVSYLLAGGSGLIGTLVVSKQFSAGTFQTAPGMMNLRSLALNLEQVIPGWLAWGFAILASVFIFGIVLQFWWDYYSVPKRKLWTQIDLNLQTRQFLTLILITYTATCAIAWHSHYYMLMPLIPILLALDYQHTIPSTLLALWILAPPAVYLLAASIRPEWAANALGLSFLVLDLSIFAWAARRYRHTAAIQPFIPLISSNCRNKTLRTG